MDSPAVKRRRYPPPLPPPPPPPPPLLLTYSLLGSILRGEDANICSIGSGVSTPSRASATLSLCVDMSDKYCLVNPNPSYNSISHQTTRYLTAQNENAIHHIVSHLPHMLYLGAPAEQAIILALLTVGNEADRA